MKKIYEKAELELKDLLIYDLINSDSTSPPDLTDYEDKEDDGSFDAG